VSSIEDIVERHSVRLDALEEHVSMRLVDSIHNIDSRLVVLEERSDVQRARFDALSERLVALSEMLMAHSERDSRENATALRAVLLAILTTIFGFSVTLAHSAGWF